MEWKAVFVEPVQMMLGKIAQFIPAFVGFLLIILVGWLIALVLKKFLVKILIFLKLDSLSGKVGFSKILEKAEIRFTLSEIIGVVFYWIVIFIALATAINALGLTSVSGIFDRMILFIPNVVVAIFVLVLGLFLSSFMDSVVVTACVNAGVTPAKILGKIVSVIVIVFSAMIALEQLNIATTIISAIITIIFASIGLAAAIAFGLGCKDMAAKWVNELVESLRKK